jgi:hypothetical protein
MVKKTVYLDEDTSLSLKYLSQTQNRSCSQIAREAIHDCAERARRIALPGVGEYSSGRSDLSDRTEEILEDAARRKLWR